MRTVIRGFSGEVKNILPPQHCAKPVIDLVCQIVGLRIGQIKHLHVSVCLLYTSDAADERSSVDLGGRRIL